MYITIATDLVTHERQQLAPGIWNIEFDHITGRGMFIQLAPNCDTCEFQEVRNMFREDVGVDNSGTKYVILGDRATRKRLELSTVHSTYRDADLTINGIGKLTQFVMQVAFGCGCRWQS